MAIRIGTVSLAALLCTSVACGSSDSSGPAPDSDAGRVAPFLSVFTFSSPIITLGPGWTVRSHLEVRDRWGRPQSLTGIISYSSNAPAIATVGRWGEITGVATGTAEISATVTIGPNSWRAVTTADVVATDEPGVLTIRAGFGGWEPSEVRVDAGTLVRWVRPPIEWKGVPISTVFLWDSSGRYDDSLDVRSGTATRVLLTAGVFRYCSDSCWNIDDAGGMIRVR